ncbi:hypothetical protein HAX54_044586, partial [Datura stramonium]|nr:hypothetical protein [Datura stramonium]
SSMLHGSGQHFAMGLLRSPKYLLSDRNVLLVIHHLVDHFQVSNNGPISGVQIYRHDLKFAAHMWFDLVLQD